MIKLIVGAKGSGKTKAMIDMINDSVKTSKGNVVVVEKGMKLTYDIAPAARLIDLDEYKVSGGEMLYGFVAGLMASNYDITDLYIDGILKVLNHDINRLGVVLDDAWFPEILNARQVGTMMAMTYESWDAELYESYLARFALPREKNFKDYSRGMRMKLAIAVALAHRPEVLLLDEATAGLDPIVRDEVLEIFREFSEAEDHAILISSHILSDLEKLCDYIAFLHQGKLLFCQEKDRLLETYGLFVGTRQQAEELAEDAVLAREDSGFGGVRAIVRRDAVPACLPLEKPTVEDIILAMVRKEQNR